MNILRILASVVKLVSTTLAYILRWLRMEEQKTTDLDAKIRRNFIMSILEEADAIKKRRAGRAANSPCLCGHSPEQHPKVYCDVKGCKCRGYDPVSITPEATVQI